MIHGPAWRARCARRASSRRSVAAARSARVRLVPVIVAVGVVGLPPNSAAVGAATAKEGVAVEAAVAMADTDEYCTGYERTFHGEWSDGAGGGRPVLFRIGVDSGGTGCYAQLNVMTPPGVAPYELRRFRVEASGDGAWTLRYRDTVLEIDSATGTAVRRKGDEAPQPGALLAHAPAVGDSPPALSAKERVRWYGKWRGRLSEVPFRGYVAVYRVRAGDGQGPSLVASDETELHGPIPRWDVGLPLAEPPRRPRHGAGWRHPRLQRLQGTHLPVPAPALTLALGFPVPRRMNALASHGPSVPNVSGGFAHGSSSASSTAPRRRAARRSKV